MNIKETVLLLQACVLDVPVIKQNDQGDGWTVTLSGTHKLNPLFETARGQIRVFKRVDAAVGVLFDVGFEEMKIIK